MPSRSDQRMKTGWIALGMRWLGSHELAVWLALLLIVGCVWIFIALAGEMIEGDTRAFDEKLIVAMRNPADHSDPVGPKWLEEFARDMTALGGMGVVTLLTVATIGFLLLQHKPRSAAFILFAVAGGLLLSSLLKSGFDRPRPELVPHGSYVYTASFPSGHSAMSAVTYLTLGALLARIQNRRRLKAYIILWALLVTIAVGVSRVYLGVHWPTDVLAGWTLGVSWALTCWLAARWLQRRRQVEED